MMNETDPVIYSKKFMQLFDMLMRIIDLRGMLEELREESPPDGLTEVEKAMERAKERLASEATREQNGEGAKGTG